MGNFDPFFSYVMKINNLRGDVPDVSATTKTLSRSIIQLQATGKRSEELLGDELPKNH